MQQKKFSTMLTLKIINVFLADSTLRESRSAKVEKGKGRGEARVKEEKRGGGGKVGEIEMRRLSTGRVEERGEHPQGGKRLGPVRQCTSASSAEGRAATLHPQPLAQGGRGVSDEVARRRGEVSGEKDGGGVRRRREEVEPMVVSAHKLQIENKKAQGGDRTPTPGRREQPAVGKRREGSGAKRGEGEEGTRVQGGKEGKRRDSAGREEGRRNKGKDTSTRDSLRQ